MYKPLKDSNLDLPLKGLKRTPCLSIQKLLNSPHFFSLVENGDFTVTDSSLREKVTGRKKEERETNIIITERKVRGLLFVHNQTPHQTKKSKTITPVVTLQSRLRGCTFQCKVLSRGVGPITYRSIPLLLYPFDLL